MTTDSKIQWTNHTWNPWTGCKHVSEGCDNCYMFRDMSRWGRKGGNITRTTPATFNKPLSYKEPAMVFTCSWSDFFIEQADVWRADAWDIIRRTPHLIYQILTKRPERIKECLPPDWGTGYPNVWLGVTCENQATYNTRWPILSQIPAFIRFISFEPLLEIIEPNAEYPMPGWVIIGGESGNGRKPITEYTKGDKTKPAFGYRVCEWNWIMHLIYKYQYQTPVFVKQLGTHFAKQNLLQHPHGGDIDEWPDNFKIREFPNQ